MAGKEIVPVRMAWDTLSEGISFVAATAVSDGFSLPYTEQDTKIVVLVQGGAAAGTLTIKKGDSIQGVSDTEAFPVGAAETKAIVLESGKFKHVIGEHKGKVIAIPSTTDLKLAALILP